MWVVLLFVVAVLAFTGIAILAWLIRRRNMQRWLGAYIWQTPKRVARRPDEVHLLLCIADHFEPKYGRPPAEQAWRRVETWVREYPRRFGAFRDADGKPPQYTFFYPIEEYEKEYLDALTDLCRAGYGEVEVHYHHMHDTAESLRQALLNFKQTLVEEHGQLCRREATGEVCYAFIHGNWVLCNWYGNGRGCGVNEEIKILRETGCYVDMTMPSAPYVTQCPKINSIYYARDIPGRPRSHERGVDVGTAPCPPDGLMLIQGPLLLDWRQRKRGILPAIENGCVQASQPPDIRRLPAWLKARVQVPQRPDWYFVKLHAHGAPEDSHEPLLGAPMVKFHQDLCRYAQKHPGFHFHYVTAREMYNLAQAAADGYRGDVQGARDHELVWNGGVPQAVADALDSNTVRD